MDNQRVVINLNRTLVKRLDIYAESVGLNRTAAVSLLLTESLAVKLSDYDKVKQEISPEALESL